MEQKTQQNGARAGQRRLWPDNSGACRICRAHRRPGARQRRSGKKALAKEPIPADVFFMGANIGEWQDGRIVGDLSAMQNDGHDPPQL